MDTRFQVPASWSAVRAAARGGGCRRRSRGGKRIGAPDGEGRDDAKGRQITKSVHDEEDLRNNEQVKLIGVVRRLPFAQRDTDKYRTPPDLAMTGEARFGSLWREESMKVPRSVSLRHLAAVWWERSGLSERSRRPTGPPPEGSVERRGFGILQKERDIADAQAAILKQGAREITSHLIENMAE